MMSWNVMNGNHHFYAWFVVLYHQSPMKHPFVMVSPHGFSIQNWWIQLWILVSHQW